MFRPTQDSSVWLGLTSREQLMSPECFKTPGAELSYLSKYLFTHLSVLYTNVCITNLIQMLVLRKLCFYTLLNSYQSCLEVLENFFKSAQCRFTANLSHLLFFYCFPLSNFKHKVSHVFHLKVLLKYLICVNTKL